MKHVKIVHMFLTLTFAVTSLPSVAAVDTGKLRQELTVYKNITMKNLSPEARYEIVRRIAEYEKATGSKEFQGLLTFVKESFLRQWEIPKQTRTERVLVAEKVYLDTLHPPQVVPRIDVATQTDQDLADWVLVEKTQEEPQELPVSKGWYDRLKEKIRAIDWKKVGIGAGIATGMVALGAMAYAGKERWDELEQERHFEAPAEEPYFGPVSLGNGPEEIPEEITIHYLLENNRELFEQRRQDTTLDLSDLKIYSLRGLWNIPHIDKVKTLNLSHNLLHDLGSQGFKEFSNLQELNLSHNLLDNLDNTPEAFDGLASLEILDLSHNQLQMIASPMVIRPLVNLKRLYLQNNQLKDVAPQILQKLIKLEYLDLSNNRLTQSIQEKLNIANTRNIIINVQNQQLATETLLSYTIRELFEQRRRGSTLDLSNLKISSLDGLEALSGVQNIEKLDLSNNLLRNLEKGKFKNFVSLKELNLARNVLDNLDDIPRIFEGLSNLEIISLNNNALTTINIDNLLGFAKIRFVDLTNNPLNREVLDTIEEREDTIQNRRISIRIDLPKPYF